MLFYLSSRIISSIAAFLYPGYASYKTLSQRPASEDDLERWLMYWSVLGCIMSVEYLAEWLVSWIPLYYPTKTLFLLYLALPQTRGSSYLYVNHLQPFFHTHESQIDAALASFKVRVYTFLQERLRALWEHVVAAVGQQQQQQRQPPSDPLAASTTSTNASDAYSPTQLVFNLWGSYGPSLIAAGTTLLRQSAAAATANTRTTDALFNFPAAAPPPPPAPTTTTRADRRLSLLERKRLLEAELATITANIAPDNEMGEGTLIPSGTMPGGVTSGAHSSSRTSSETDLRERTVSGGKFEEIEVPSDVEGYYGGGSGSDNDTKKSGTPGRTSWFGWGSSQMKGGYERVKSE